MGFHKINVESVEGFQLFLLLKFGQQSVRCLVSFRGRFKLCLGLLLDGAELLGIFDLI